MRKETRHINMIRIQNDIGLLTNNSGTQETMEQWLQNFEGKENLQRILYPAKPSNKYYGTLKSIFICARSQKADLKCNLSQGHLQNVLTIKLWTKQMK